MKAIPIFSSNAFSSVLLCLLLAFSAVATAQSGDPTVDNWLAPFEYKNGNNSIPTAIAPPNYPILNSCNSSSSPPDEANCPSDLLYTPNANTGGSQAFGMGANLWEGGQYYYTSCWLVPYYDSEGWLRWTYYCQTQLVNVTAHTYGIAAAAIKFGQQTIATPWGTTPMSTLAFSSHVYDGYNPQPQLRCTPNLIYVGTGWGSAPCNSSVENVYIVPNVGYEDKIVLSPDAGCNPPFWSVQPNLRSGEASDADYGCFVRDGSNWWTNLPSPYPDTTRLDGAATYVPGVGSASPEAIMEGQTYHWGLNFFQWGLEPGDHTIRHSSAVTTFIDNVTGGSIIGLDCTPSRLYDCYFNVDQTSISSTSPLP